jgi:hypothetical protein
MIIIDNKDCFDKASKCPCKIKIPTTKTGLKKIDYIIKQLKFWGTNEGFKISNEYIYDKWINEYN